MKALRLELEGFTSFRDNTVLELEGLDLFAITGPTGAGKSSLIDALVFALYGQVPRVGREYKQLLSHGSERLSVRLDFEVGATRYRIARTARSKGTPQVRLERLVGGEAQPIADRVSEIEAEVQRIVGLDYDAFTRSVVLPQGQFDRFLTGKPEERRKILVALLNLEVFERMQRLANQRASEARREADFIERQLKDDFAGVTPQAISAAASELAAARAAEERLGGQQTQLGAAIAAAQGLRALRLEHERLCQEVRRETQRLADARAQHAAATAERAPLLARLAAARERSASPAFDAGRHVVLVSALPRVEELARATARVQEVETRSQDALRRLQAARDACQAADGALPARQAAAEQAEAELRAARVEREELQTRHAAHALRPQLTKGAACPVCEQPVGKLPKSAAPPALERSSGRERSAEKALDAARRAHDEARLAHERAKAAKDALARECEHAGQLLRDEGERRRALLDELAALGFADPRPAELLARMQAERQRLEAARTESERLVDEVRRCETQSAELERRLAVAQAQVDEAARRTAELQGREQGAQAERQQAEDALHALAQGQEWKAPAAREGHDELAALEARRTALQAELHATAAAGARLEAELRQLRERLERASALDARRQELQATATLAADLAAELRADQFVAYVQEEALQILAQDGSRHLEGLSQGRYVLACESQEFFVVDRWNADAQRSVRTLSGGETFLASLALALALAESLARLSAEGRHAEALDSLFLDEGFGSLDAETLDTVVDALEELHGGRRLVGVVTHIPELAQRLPARVEVARGPKSATVRIV